jgi:hypothetical protein
MEACTIAGDLAVAMHLAAVYKHLTKMYDEAIGMVYSERVEVEINLQEFRKVAEVYQLEMEVNVKGEGGGIRSVGC